MEEHVGASYKWTLEDKLDKFSVLQNALLPGDFFVVVAMWALVSYPVQAFYFDVIGHNGKMTMTSFFKIMTGTKTTAQDTLVILILIFVY